MAQDKKEHRCEGMERDETVEISIRVRWSVDCWIVEKEVINNPVAQGMDASYYNEYDQIEDITHCPWCGVKLEEEE